MVLMLMIQLRCSAPDKIAVHDLCLAIDEGECFGLLGPNGAGKTTTISILTGLFPPSAGHATICGYDIRTEMDSIHRVMSVWYVAGACELVLNTVQPFDSLSVVALVHNSTLFGVCMACVHA
jgi:ABC-type multidrug transport system ATPase subunit